MAKRNLMREWFAEPWGSGCETTFIDKGVQNA